MGHSDAYVITDPLRDEAYVAIYHGLRVRDHERVVIKMLGPKRRRPRDLERLKNEFEIASRLDTPSVARPLAFDTCLGAPALILKDCGGSSLGQRPGGAAMELGPFLRLAVGLAKAVGDIHALGVIHKDIKPDNVLVQGEGDAVQLTDFELSSLLPREQPVAVGPHLIEGSLPYMSPEQTGRTNRAIDCRSDLYALGVTLFELRAGRLPFVAADPLGWIHCHLARKPPSLAQQAPGTPEMVAQIVAKLLAKTPEERYQSARGLQRDLERCHDAWVADGRIADFPLGVHDFSDRFQIPQRLYGREQESGALLGAFERVVATGAPALVLVSGYAGVGKTTLVRELYKPIVRERGYFVAGKFDRYDRGIPYATLVQAWQELLRELYSEPPEEVARWGQMLREALGINAPLLIDILPELELFVGPQAPVAALTLAEAERRFLLVARQLIGVVAKREHPLVLFLDDLQWADAASLKLLEALLTVDTRHLLIIGAYRDNEVAPAHPLHAALQAIGQAGIAITQVFLGPLSRPHIGQLVADTVHTAARQAEPLTALIDETTAGNPLFVTQLLTSLHEHELLHFDRLSGSWRWDLDEIGAGSYATNVVDLMVTRLNGLPPPTLQALQLAACAGNVFDLEALAIICDRSSDDTRRELWDAVRAGVVVRSDGTYRFVHDRVQEAAHSLIPVEQRCQLHLEIGRRLYAHTPAPRLSERIFDIVGQLNRAAALIDDPAERDCLAELNLLAARRARAATAYASAVEFSATGSALLGHDAWQRRYELSYRLHLERAECEYMNHALERAEALLMELIRRARTPVDKAASYAVAVQLFMTKGDVARSLACGLDSLREFGIEVPARPTRAQVEAEYHRVLADMHPIDALVDLPLMTDRETIALMTLLTVAVAPAFWTDFEVYAWLVGLAARLSLIHGNTDASAHLYVSFGAVVGEIFGRYGDAERLGNVGLVLINKRGLSASKARGLYSFAGFITHWVEPIDRGILRFDAAFAASLESGNSTVAGYCSQSLIMLLLLKGEPLVELQRKIGLHLDAAGRARARLVLEILGIHRFFVERLRGYSREQEDDLERRLMPVPLVLFTHYLRAMQWHFLVGELEEAQAAAEKAQPLAWAVLLTPLFADFVFFHALVLLQMGRREHLDDYQRRLALWAESSPETFAARAQLVAAEVARRDGREREAMRLYEQVIADARARGMVHIEAIARELAAQLYDGMGLGELANVHCGEARACYLRWGALAKVHRLETEHPALASWHERTPPTFIGRDAELDLVSVLKASQTISSEIVLDELSRTLMRVVLEQGGAQRGCLILEQQGRLVIEAMAELESDGVRVELHPAVALADGVPATIVAHTAQSGERVILDDAQRDAGPFADDPYLPRCRPRSALCLVIRRHEQAVGYLYLENALLAGVFTRNRLEVAELLASQAAVSLENARLLTDELTARRAAEAAQQRSAFLAEAGVLLAESLDHERVLARVAQLIVRSLADWCAFDLIEDGQIRRRAGAHADPSRAPLLLELARRYPPAWDSPHPQVEILRHGRPLIVPDVSGEYIRQHTVDAGHAGLIRQLGMVSTLAVPLKVRERVLGAITMASTTPARRYGPTELALAEELARVAALAVDNALLYRQARYAIQLREEFLSLASHELRTPITWFLITVEWVYDEWRRGPMARDATRTLLTRILQQGKRLKRQVEELLDVARIQAGKLRLEPSDVDLAELVNDVLASLAIGLERAGCGVTLDAPEPVHGRWDRARMEQVVSNLLWNALKFGAGRPIAVTVRNDGQRAQLTVRDQGIGIDPAQHEHIFDRFARAVPPRQFGGVGLGLFICREIVNAHGGTIRVHSRLGQGATFIVDLPNGAS
jgi:predicted ATPase/signal transduction histidine kinase/tRNA A-37 threonylcarbamoyl transferase component Bud32